MTPRARTTHVTRTCNDVFFFNFPMKTLNEHAFVFCCRKFDVGALQYTKTRKRFYAEVRIMTSTMDVDDRSDSDDDEEIVERGAFNALVVVTCALQKSYRTLFFLFGLRLQREREGRRSKHTRANFFFCIQQRTNSKKRNASFDCFRTRSSSRFLFNRARRERLCIVVKTSRWT